MRNFVRNGDTFTVIAAQAYTSGDGVIVGSIFGIASTNVLLGQQVEICVEGVFALPKAAGALAQGVAVFWTVGAGPGLGTVAAAGTAAPPQMVAPAEHRHGSAARTSRSFLRSGRARPLRPE